MSANSTIKALHQKTKNRANFDASFAIQNQLNVEKSFRLVVAKINSYNEDTGFIIFRAKPNAEFLAHYPELAGINSYSSQQAYITVKGKLGYKPLVNDPVIVMGGKVDFHKTYGYSFLADYLSEESAAILLPDGKVQLSESYMTFETMSQFMAKVLKVKGIGKKTAYDLLTAAKTHFQYQHQYTEPQIIEMLAQMIVDEPLKFIELLNTLKKEYKLRQLNEDNIEALMHKWVANFNEQKAVALLMSVGVQSAIAKRLAQRFGSRAYEIITENPYDLIRVAGVGFKTADALGILCGLDAYGEKRMQGAILALAKQLTQDSGDTVLASRAFYHKLVEFLLFQDDKKGQKALQTQMQREFESQDLLLQIKLDKVPLHYGEKLKADNEISAFMLMSDFDVEKEIAKMLVSFQQYARPCNSNAEPIINRKEKIANGVMIELDPSQKDAIRLVLQNGISGLTGGAGCGKTTVLKRILDCAESAGFQCCLISPTGKAANRMKETTGREAKTIHTLLGYTGVRFEYNRTKQIPEYNWFFIDESSMIDMYLAQAFFEAIPLGSRITFIGDYNQLPSVNKGAFLYDFINSGAFPIAKLQVTHRQADGNDINDVARAVLENNPKALQLTSRKNVHFVAYEDKKHRDDVLDQNSINSQLEKDLVQNYTRLVQQYGIVNVQVLTPTRIKSRCLSSEYLNPLLRKAYMTMRLGYTPRLDNQFMVGDRVIGKKNNSIFKNGEVGTVISYQPKTATSPESLQVVFDHNPKESVECGEEIKHLDFGYAITVHKSQGSEYKFVLIPLSRSDFMLFNRNWLYTAITRGKQQVFLYGQQTAINKAVRTQSTERQTLLQYLFLRAKQK